MVEFVVSCLCGILSQETAAELAGGVVVLWFVLVYSRIGKSDQKMLG